MCEGQQCSSWVTRFFWFIVTWLRDYHDNKQEWPTVHKHQPPPPLPVNQNQLSNPFPKWWFPSNCWGTHQYNPPVLWSSRSSPVYRLILKPVDDCHWRKHSLSRTGCDLPRHTAPDHSTAMRSKVMLILFIFILVIKVALKQIIRD